MSKLPADCLNGIFEYLEEDEATLRSCLLVNRLWCEVSVRILWKSIRNYNTLIACLPNESKEILYENGIITSTSDSKPPMFNYSSFCKVLLVDQLDDEIRQLLKNQQSFNTVMREIFKLLMNQISLKKIEFYDSSLNIPNFTLFPGAKGCLKNLTELYCDSYISSEIFYQLSQICHNIQSLSIKFEEFVSNGLADLISVQQNLKYLNMYNCGLLTADISLSFIAKLTNLREMTLSFYYQFDFKDFKILQHVTFSHLRVLKFECDYPRDELLTKFLENNGRNLKKFYAGYCINFTTAKFCPNLRKLSGIGVKEIETLKMILNSCQCLESISTWCCGCFLSEKEILEVIVKHSPKDFHELKLYYLSCTKSELLPEELESIFASWANRIPFKPISLFIMLNVL